MAPQRQSATSSDLKEKVRFAKLKNKRHAATPQKSSRAPPSDAVATRCKTPTDTTRTATADRGHLGQPQCRDQRSGRAAPPGHAGQTPRIFAGIRPARYSRGYLTAMSFCGWRGLQVCGVPDALAGRHVVGDRPPYRTSTDVLRCRGRRFMMSCEDHGLGGFGFERPLRFSFWAAIGSSSKRERA